VKERRAFYIRDIERAKKFQGREAISTKTVLAYTKKYRAGTPMNPVQIALLKGRAILVDGWHRIAALERLGSVEVEAEVVTVQNEAEAMRLAATANRQHGVPLSSRDLRRSLCLFLRAGGHRPGPDERMTYRDLAAEFGRSHGTIYNWMRRCCTHCRAIAHDEMGRPEQSRATGGLRKAPMTIPEESPSDAVRRALRAAVARFRSVPDEAERAQLLQEVVAIVEEMKTVKIGEAPPVPVEDF
jgi:hypothetical protein